MVSRFLFALFHGCHILVFLNVYCRNLVPVGVAVMTSLSTKEFIVGLYAAYAAGDPGPSLAATDDDIELEYVGPKSIFAFCGARKGKTQALEAMQQITDQFRLDAMDVDRVLVDGDDFCVQLQASFTDRRTGAKLKAELVDVGRLRNGKIVWLKEYWDVEKATVQLMGQPLVLAGSIVDK
jgi:ketosteroid isomerase-like protein